MGPPYRDYTALELLSTDIIDIAVHDTSAKQLLPVIIDSNSRALYAFAVHCVHFCAFLCILCTPSYQSYSWSNIKVRDLVTVSGNLY